MPTAPPVPPEVVGSFSERTWNTRFATFLSAPTVRPRVMAIAKLLGFRDEQWIRVVMNRETLKLVLQLPTRNLDVAEISGCFWRDRCPFKSYTTLDYPEFDICSESTERKFDLVIAEQVFEHVLWPYRGAKNVFDMLRPGGHFLITLPFLIRIHGYPTDCSRWTEVGLRHFLAECGFPLDEIVTGSWGNTSCVRSNLWVWKRYHPLLHSLRNERDFPMNVWALARRPN
jgi:SAM-dependent methyltransferase